MSWRVENLGKRAFISDVKDFVKGGTFDLEKKFKYLAPNGVADVTDAYGAILSKYPEVRVLSKSKAKEPKEPKD